MMEPHKEIVNGCEFWMLPVEGGTFDMGDAHGDLWYACRPVHGVKVSNFYIGKYSASQALWNAVMKNKNPSWFQGDDRPVEQVSWDDITKRFLPELHKLTGLEYRLPTEAEWEYAARGGKFHSEGCKYAGSDRLTDVGWFNQNSNKETKSVGLKYPNQLGIYDMSGSVWEWCEDDWHGNYEGAPKNGSAWVDKPNRAAGRVYRGGGWLDVAQTCRVAYRHLHVPVTRLSNVGFRLALTSQ